MEEVAEPCAVWAVPRGEVAAQDGSRERPFVGLSTAVSRRGDCDRIILTGSSEDMPFDARVDVAVDVVDRLTIEGDPGDSRLQVLDAAGRRGMAASGDGGLLLRRLAFVGGSSERGGCLEANLAEVELDETSWGGCGATYGGAVWIWADRTTIAHSEFIANEATEDAGAALVSGPAESTVIDVGSCLFEGNTSNLHGALLLRSPTASLAVRNSVFLHNRAASASTALGGMLAGLVEGNRFEGNEGWFSTTAAIHGETAATSEIAHNIFVGNRSRNGAPAIAIAPAYGTILNNLFVDNTCGPDDGSGGCAGAVFLVGGDPVLRNNTFVGNSGLRGPAHISFGTVFGRVVGNLLVDGAGSGSIGVHWPESGGGVTVDYTDSWGVPDPPLPPEVVAGPGNMAADPLLVGPDAGDYRLRAGSPCRDAGDPAPDRNDPDGSRNDIGAFGGPLAAWTPLEVGGAP